MMNYTNKTLTAVVAMSLGLGLSACGSDKTDMTANVKAKLKTIMAVRKAKKAGGTAPAAAAQAPTRASFAKAGIPVAYIGSPQTKYGGFAVQVEENGKFDTYMTSEKYSVTVVDGVVMATRGFVGDLMSQGLSIPVSDMFKGPFPVEYERTQSMLDLDVSVKEFTYKCSISAPEARDLRVLDEVVKTNRFKEVCRASHRAFQNDYWTEVSNGRVIQSQQSVHPNTGYIIWQSIAR
jgi:hypothetical protein